MFSPDGPEEQQENQHVADRVMNIGMQFAKEWLTISSIEHPNDYKRRIVSFIKPDMFSSNAGMQYPSGSEQKFSQKVESAWAVSVETLDDTHYTANIGVLLDTNGVKRRFVVNVPVAYDERTDQFVVYENPSFSPLPEVSDGVGGMDFGEAGDVANPNQLRTTMSNFFAKYIDSEDPAELANFLIDSAKGKINPKGGIVNFQSIQDMVTYPRGQTSDGAYNVYMGKVRVLTVDPVSNLNITSDYIVIIYEQNDKYLIGNISP